MKLKTELLLRVGSYIGNSKVYKSSLMNKFIIGYRSGICIFDVNQTEFMLKRALNFYIDVISSRGKALFISDEVSLKSRSDYKYIKSNERFFLGQKYISSWIDGNISNMNYLFYNIKMTNMDSGLKLGSQKHLLFPSVVILLEDKSSKYFIMNECCKLKIPLIALVNSDMIPTMTFFPIPSNNIEEGIIFFYKKLFHSAFKLGILKEVVAFNKHLYLASANRKNTNVKNEDDRVKYNNKSEINRKYLI